MPAPWNLPERDATPEAALLTRRRMLIGLGLTGLTAAAGGYYWWNNAPEAQVLARGQALAADGHYPATRNPRFAELDRDLTAEGAAARFTNFYEFSSGKQVWRYVEPFQPRPWTLEVAGLVARPRIYDFDDLLQCFSLEERLYRHRCVETWAMAVPWTGFPLADVLRKAEPLAGARYVKFVTFHRPNEADRQGDGGYPWPYTEGLTLAEATNELTFLATGMYSHPLLKQHGAPVRLVVPWKYGFKSAKSLVRIEVTASQPATFWNTLSPLEYDFQANVNPRVPHPRWSQASERMLGTGETRRTVLYNGYGEWVGKLYPS